MNDTGADPIRNTFLKLFIAGLFIAPVGSVNIAMAETSKPICQVKTSGGPLWITADCVDSEFSHPVIDHVAEISQPVTLHKVSGHFEGTQATFNFYFPPKKRWEGRFFQNVYPLTDGNARSEMLGFGADSGAYTVQTGGTTGYRADAAAAKFSRTVARNYYGNHTGRVYGYIYGGSGGSYQTIAAMENSQGVWDGAVPYVIGTPTSIPNNFFIRAFARVVLQNKARQIADAMSPGGDGHPWKHLDNTERAVLKEVTAMGVPLRGWDNPAYLLGLEDPAGLMGFRDTVKKMDPTYADDFWSKAGYLGQEKSALGDIFRTELIQQNVHITGKETFPLRLKLDKAPKSDLLNMLEFTLLDAQGASLGEVKGLLDPATDTFTVSEGNGKDISARVLKAASLKVDNRWSLALTAYHRYQMPKETGIKTWDQFRRPDGSVIYPQRSVEVGPLISGGAAGGGTFTGHINGKMIVLGNLLDVDAFPWDGDWYAQRVKAATGNHFNDTFRLWFNDNADHHDGSVITSGNNDGDAIRLVSYVGILQQAVLDVSQWVEKGKSPALSTRYEVIDGQVSVAKSAPERQGIQPVVKLTSDGNTRIDIKAGENMTLTGIIHLPDGAGSVVATEWSQTGRGEFAPAHFRHQSGRKNVVKQSFTFNRPGVFYPVLRVTTRREGKTGTPYTRVSNLDRLRVTVR